MGRIGTTIRLNNRINFFYIQLLKETEEKAALWLCYVRVKIFVNSPIIVIIAWYIKIENTKLREAKCNIRYRVPHIYFNQSTYYP